MTKGKIFVNKFIFVQKHFSRRHKSGNPLNTFDHMQQCICIIPHDAPHIHIR